MYGVHLWSSTAAAFPFLVPFTNRRRLKCATYAGCLQRVHQTKRNTKFINSSAHNAHTRDAYFRFYCYVEFIRLCICLCSMLVGWCVRFFFFSTRKIVCAACIQINWLVRHEKYILSRIRVAKMMHTRMRTGPAKRINKIYFPVLNFLERFSNVDVHSSDVHSLILLVQMAKFLEVKIQLFGLVNHATTDGK